MSLHADREDECWEIATMTESKDGGWWAIAAGLFAIANAQRAAAHHLGNGDAATSMGAIEAFGKHIGEKIDTLADAIVSAHVS
jgi:hypothetical protein